MQFIQFELNKITVVWSKRTGFVQKIVQRCYDTEQYHCYFSTDSVQSYINFSQVKSCKFITFAVYRADMTFGFAKQNVGLLILHPFYVY